MAGGAIVAKLQPAIKVCPQPVARGIDQLAAGKIMSTRE